VPGTLDWNEVVMLDADTGLLTKPLVASLLTSGANGAPHLAAVWFRLRENGTLIVGTSSASVKARNARHRRDAQLMIEDTDGVLGSWGVVFGGIVEVVDGDTAVRLNDEIFSAYIAAAWRELAEVAAFESFDDVTLVFYPESARVWDFRLAPAAEAVRQLIA
jgi:pyridoxamine 5'-phosphate oxidase-like protein